MSELQNRVTELETKVAFLEHANQQMSDLIYAQQKQLDRHISRTAQQIEGILATQVADNPGDEVPPHY